MKAIQIRYISATDTKPTRLKVWAEGVKPMIACRDSALDVDQQARGLAEKYIQANDWGYSYVGFGCLPNGDYVATLGE